MPTVSNHFPALQSSLIHPALNLLEANKFARGNMSEIMTEPQNERQNYGRAANLGRRSATFGFSSCSTTQINQTNLYQSSLIFHNHWRIQGAPPASPPPNRIHFFRFCIRFCQKCTHQRSAPPRMGRCPPNGKFWIRH